LSVYLHENVSSPDITNRKLNQTIYDLKRRNYIDFGPSDSVILTNKAKIKIIDKIIKTKKQDGHYRLISFDIPEDKRNNRNNFRRAIKRMGFKQVQKSLWVSKENVGELVEIAANEYKVSQYIAYFIVDKSNIDSHLNKLFESMHP